MSQKVGRNPRQTSSKTDEIDKIGQVLEQLVDAFDVVPEGIAVFDADDRYVMWNRQYAEIYAPVADSIAVGVRFEDVLRATLAKGLVLDAVGREEQWLAMRLAGHRQATNVQEHHMLGDKWIRAQERLTASDGRVSVRTDITELKQSEASFRLLFENNPIPMFVCDAASLGFLAANDAAVAHYGYTAEQFSTMSVYDLRLPDDRDELRHRARTGDAVRQTGSVRRHVKADGTQIDVEIYATPMRYRGAPATIFAAIDITERVRVETRLRDQQMHTDMAVNNMMHGLVMFDGDARLVLWNRRYIEMYGMSPDVVRAGCGHREMLEHRKELGVFSGDIDAYCQATLARVAAGKPWTRILELPDGRTIQTLQRPMPGGGWVSTHEDITERQAAQRQIEHLAHNDALTGLPNRAAFGKYLAVALDSARQQSKTLAVLCIDVDRFKEVNDAFGHATGDELLKTVAKRLEHIAGGEFTARLGGDEFSIVIADGRQLEAIEAFTENLQAAIADEITVNGHLVHTSLSIGVAVYPTDGTDPAVVLANADAALYRAKRDGRGCIRFFNAEMDQQIRERRLLQHALRFAIERGEFTLVYQPEARTSGEIVGFEALARWRHPRRGLIDPNVFIPLAEDNGLIIQMGEQVLRQACHEAASWGRPLQVAVNLSPVQFRHGDLPALVHTVLLETGLAPQRLELEITEGILIDDFTRAISVLRRLKALGVKIALDDFGAGYSSLSYLHAFPFDKIKIDRSFVADLDVNPQSPAIIRAIIGLAHGLSLPASAEGVETKEQFAFLQREACDIVQGFLIGRPRDIANYAEVVGKPVPVARDVALTVV